MFLKPTIDGCKLPFSRAQGLWYAGRLRHLTLQLVYAHQLLAPTEYFQQRKSQNYPSLQLLTQQWSKLLSTEKSACTVITIYAHFKFHLSLVAFDLQNTFFSIFQKNCKNLMEEKLGDQHLPTVLISFAKDILTQIPVPVLFVRDLLKGFIASLSFTRHQPQDANPVRFTSLLLKLDLCSLCLLFCADL